MSFSEWKETELGRIPIDWKIIKLGEEIEVLNGYAFKSNDFIDDTAGVPVIKIKNIIPPKIEINDVQYVSEKLAQEKSKYLLQYDDILISLTGSNVNQMTSAVGKVGRVREKEKKILLNQRVGKLELKRGSSYDYNFLYYLMSRFETQYVLASSAGGSANQANISGKHIKELKVVKPPLNEARKIGEILKSLDDKIELNNQMNQTLEEMAQSLFKHWFVDFEFPNEDGEPYRSSGGEMEPIPKGWCVSKLGEVVTLKNKSINPQKNLDTLFEHYSIPALDDNRLPVFEDGEDIKSSKYLINKNTILISKLNPHFKRIWFPYCETENSICSTEFMPYEPIKLNTIGYCYELINSEEFTNLLLQHTTGSTGSRQRVKPKETLDYAIFLPPENLMINFSKTITPFHNKIKENIQQNKKLIEIRDSLIPKLMSGEVRV